MCSRAPVPRCGRRRLVISSVAMGAGAALFLFAVRSNGQATESVEVTASNVEIVIAGSEVKAGDLFSFTLKLDKAPNFSGGQVQYVIVGPHSKYVGDCTAFSDYRLSYNCEFRVPAIGPPGKWRIKSAYFIIGNKKIKLTNAATDFRVLPNPGVILPTRAELALNGSQTDLLRREAQRLGDRIQLLKSGMSHYEKASNKRELEPGLREYLNFEIAESNKTQAEFIRMSPAEDERASAEIFFQDLRTGYHEAIDLVQRSAATLQIFSASLIPVSDDTQDRVSSPLLAVALRPFEENELAYNVVADSGSLTFDLEVDSDPPGATISYRRRGDQPRVNPNPTNSTVHSLPYAIWLVKFEKAGYTSIEREHDPFRESNHIIHVQMRR
jgi:hypothetical protein